MACAGSGSTRGALPSYGATFTISLPRSGIRRLRGQDDPLLASTVLLPL
jgi:hypothetical protein